MERLRPFEKGIRIFFGCMYLAVILIDAGILPNPVPALVRGLAYMAFFGSGYTVLSLFIRRLEYFNVEAFFRNMNRIAVAVVVFAVLPHLLEWLGGAFNRSSLLLRVHGAIDFNNSMLFVLALSLNFRRFVFIERTATVRKLWMFLQAWAILGLFSELLLVVPLPAWAIQAYLGIAGVVILTLLPRQNWVALLNRRSRLVSLTAFSFLCASLGLLIANQWYALVPDFSTPRVYSAHLFVIVLGGYAAIYAAYSFLTLLMHLPVSRMMDDKNAEIDGIFQIGRILGKDVQNERILRQMFEKCTALTKSSIALATYKNPKTGRTEIIGAAGLDESQQKKLAESYLSPAYMDRGKLTHLNLADTQSQAVFKKMQFPMQSMLVVRVGRDLGIEAQVYLGKRYRGGYDEYQVNRVVMLAEQAEMSLSNNALLREVVGAERLKEDLEIGRAVQRRLLPSAFYLNGTLDVAARSASAEEVGGDYYDYHRFDEDRFGIVVADVSGKGTKAAFHVAEIKGIFQAIMLSCESPTDFVRNANKAVCRSFDRGTFVTMVYMLVDLKKGEVRYVRAGHCPLLLYSNATRSARYLEDEGLALGIVKEDEDYAKSIHERSFAFSPGDKLLAYSDGVVEARDVSGAEFGYERLQRLFRRTASWTATQTLREIDLQLKEFYDGTAQFDDITMLVMRSHPEASVTPGHLMA